MQLFLKGMRQLALLALTLTVMAVDLSAAMGCMKPSYWHANVKIPSSNVCGSLFTSPTKAQIWESCDTGSQILADNLINHSTLRPGCTATPLHRFYCQHTDNTFQTCKHVALPDVEGNRGWIPKVAVEITNLMSGHSLYRIGSKVASGQAESALQPPLSIQTNHMGLGVWVGTSTKGPKGVVVYDIVGTDLALAVMWSAPVPASAYKDWANVKVVKKDEAADLSKLTNELYSSATQEPGEWWADRAAVKQQEHGIRTETRFYKASTVEHRGQYGDPWFTADSFVISVRVSDGE